jgi:hypothetical protein
MTAVLIIDGKKDSLVAWNNVIIRMLVNGKETFVKEKPISPSPFLPFTQSFFMAPTSVPPAF